MECLHNWSYEDDCRVCLGCGRIDKAEYPSVANPISDKPKTVKMTDKGWAMVMDLGLLEDGADLEKIAQESGERLEILEFMRNLAWLTLKQMGEESQ